MDIMAFTETGFIKSLAKVFGKGDEVDGILELYTSFTGKDALGYFLSGDEAFQQMLESVTVEVNKAFDVFEISKHPGDIFHINPTLNKEDRDCILKNVERCVSDYRVPNDDEVFSGCSEIENKEKLYGLIYLSLQRVVYLKLFSVINTINEQGNLTNEQFEKIEAQISTLLAKIDSTDFSIKEVTTTIIEMLNTSREDILRIIEQNKQTTSENIEELCKKVQDRKADDFARAIISKKPKPTVPAFTDRTEDIDRLHRLLDEKGWVFVSGISGIGKSQLVVKYINDNISNYDVICFLTYDGSLISTIGNLPLSGYTNSENESLDTQYSFRMERLNELGRTALVVIDNFDRTNTRILADGSFPSAILDPEFLNVASAGFDVVYTSRVAYEDTEHLVPLDNLDADSQIELFLKHYPKVITDHNIAVIKRILNLINGHTLMIELIARLLKTNRLVKPEIIANVLEHDIKQMPEQLVSIQKDGVIESRTIEAHVQSLFDLSHFSDKQKHALRNMTLVPQSGIEIQTFCDWAGVDEVQSLIDLHWIIHDDQSDVVSLHRIIRLAVRAALNPTYTACRAYVDSVTRMSTVQENSDAPWETYQRTLEIASAVIQGLDGKPDDNIYQLYINIADMQRKLYHFEDAYNVYTDVVDNIDAGLIVVPIISYIGIILNKGRCQFELGKISEAGQSFEYALGIALVNGFEKSEEAPIKSMLAKVYYQIARYHKRQRDYQLAMRYSEMALKLRERIETAESITSMLQLADISFTCNEYQKAYQHCNNALECYENEDLDNQKILASIYAQIGRVVYAIGDYQKSLDFYIKSFEIRSRLYHHNSPIIAQSYANLGVAYGRLGLYNRAIEAHITGLEIRIATLPSTHRKVASSLNNVGKYYTLDGKYAEAIEYHQKALGICNNSTEDMNSMFGTKVASMDLLGRALRLANRPKEALDLHLEAYQLRKNSTKVKQSSGLATTMLDIGNDYLALGDYDNALEWVNKATEIRKQRRGEDHQLYGECLICQGEVWEAMGEREKALNCYHEALNIYKLLPDHIDTKKLKMKIDEFFMESR